MSLKENPNTQESAFQPPNYTQIPNVIFDEWMPILSPASFKTLLCICRKTFGWHKSSDCISRNQLMKQTGLSKATVKTAIDDLIEKGLVFKICTSGEYGHCPNSYRLNIVKPLFENEEDQNLGGGRSNSDLGVGQNLTEGVGQILTTQKKPSTKETSSSSPTPPSKPKDEPKKSAPLEEEEPSPKEKEEMNRRYAESCSYAESKGNRAPIKNKKWMAATLKSIRESAINGTGSTIEENMRIAKDLVEKMQHKRSNAEFESCPDYLQITSRGHAFILPYGDKDFKLKLQKQLEKMGIKHGNT